NQADNSSTLDSQDFTVFGNIANDASLFILDTIAGLPTFTFEGLSNFPLLNYTSGRTVTDSNYLYVNSIAPITPVDTAPGVVNAATSVSNTTTGISPGEFITIYGKELGPTALTSLALDSSGQTVTNNLQGTQVLFNGIPGPMIFTSTGQIAAIVPYGIAGGSTVNVVVSYLGIQTAPLQFKVVPANPGLFTLSATGKGDAAIVRASDGSVVSVSSPAAVGDTLELYGQGYGAVSNGFGDGALVTAAFTVPNTTLLIDGQKVDTSYTGCAGDGVNGEMQINFVVPQLTPGNHQIQIQVGSAISPSGVTLQTN
ncbi:MAG TPA: IPT/TIG domain-containing protein, partial [Bryobacteraceae bacterium]|nr:IPT/TIG domain-containing protein [Bryobacteraceae bacterium]